MALGEVAQEGDHLAIATAKARLEDIDPLVRLEAERTLMTLKAGLFRKTPVSEPALGSSDSVVAAQIMSTVGIAGDAHGLNKVDTHVENKEVRFAVLRKKLPS